MLRGFCLGLVALAVILLIACVIGGFLLLRPSESPQQVQRTSDPSAAARFDEKLARLDMAAPGTQTAFTEEEVNAKIAQLLKQSEEPLPLRDVRVALEEGKVRVSADTQASGRTVAVSAVVALEGQNGKLRIEIRDVRAGSLPLPKALTDQLLQQVSQGLGIADLSSVDLPLNIQGLRVEQGKLVVSK